MSGTGARRLLSSLAVVLRRKLRIVAPLRRGLHRGGLLAQKAPVGSRCHRDVTSALLSLHGRGRARRSSSSRPARAGRRYVLWRSVPSCSHLKHRSFRFPPAFLIEENLPIAHAHFRSLSLGLLLQDSRRIAFAIVRAGAWAFLCFLPPVQHLCRAAVVLVFVLHGQFPRVSLQLPLLLPFPAFAPHPQVLVLLGEEFRFFGFLKLGRTRVGCGVTFRRVLLADVGEESEGPRVVYSCRTAGGGARSRSRSRRSGPRTPSRLGSLGGLTISRTRRGRWGENRCRWRRALRREVVDFRIE
mmetsp:Transcript_7630/g.18423  ORF Transcript_7630/g.18423 Transcript_7630/m.18423 type:complete len:299 (-) Transcript_7630:842-1738(-)